MLAGWSVLKRAEKRAFTFVRWKTKKLGASLNKFPTYEIDFALNIVGSILEKLNHI